MALTADQVTKIIWLETRMDLLVDEFLMRQKTRDKVEEEAWVLHDYFKSVVGSDSEEWKSYSWSIDPMSSGAERTPFDYAFRIRETTENEQESMKSFVNVLSEKHSVYYLPSGTSPKGKFSFIGVTQHPDGLICHNGLWTAIEAKQNAESDIIIKQGTINHIVNMSQVGNPIWILYDGGAFFKALLGPKFMEALLSGEIPSKRFYHERNRKPWRRLDLDFAREISCACIGVDARSWNGIDLSSWPPPDWPDVKR